MNYSVTSEANNYHIPETVKQLFTSSVSAIHFSVLSDYNEKYKERTQQKGGEIVIVAKVQVKQANKQSR